MPGMSGHQFDLLTTELDELCLVMLDESARHGFGSTNCRQHCVD